MAKLVARRSLGSNPDISQKYKMADISKGVVNIARQKYMQKTFREGEWTRAAAFVIHLVRENLAWVGGANS